VNRFDKPSLPIQRQRDFTARCLLHRGVSQLRSGAFFGAHPFVKSSSPAIIQADCLDNPHSSATEDHDAAPPLNRGRSPRNWLGAGSFAGEGKDVAIDWYCATTCLWRERKRRWAIRSRIAADYWPLERSDF